MEMNVQYGKKLEVGVYIPEAVPQSFKVYSQNVMRRLSDHPVNLHVFSSEAMMPQGMDLIWDIRSGGGNPPPQFLIREGMPPFVMTVHGFAPTTLPGHEYFDRWIDSIRSGYFARKKRAAWAAVRDRVDAVIAVSEFTKSEMTSFTSIPREKVFVCHHGVDFERFNSSESKPGRCFLHISNDEPRKNIARILKAFAEVRREHADIELLLKVPRGSAGKYEGIDGVRVISRYLDENEISRLYSEALAFVFPSLYEGFGMPILESMASRCPVITSNDTACVEVAGAAALIVDPRSHEALVLAMKNMIEDQERVSRMRTEGQSHAALFSWEKSAGCHYAVFKDVVERKRELLKAAGKST